jgi:putative transposase
MNQYEFIRAKEATYSVAEMCRVLEVSTSAYYTWRNAPPSQRERDDERLQTAIIAAHEANRKVYGSPRITEELQAQGEKVGRRRVARLMRKNRISGLQKRRWRRTTDSRHKLPLAENILDRNFMAAAPNQVWVGDITYVWTTQGWAYVAVIIDLFSRKVVGWAVRNTLGRELAIAALTKALMLRKPPEKLVHHTDRGCQYASREYRQHLAAHGLIQSMSRAGNCYDNAACESFFASLKKELVHRVSFATRTEAYDAIADYIDNFYNPIRRHSAIGHRSPVEHESSSAARLAA